MTTTWTAAATAKAREALPRLQRDLDAARVRLDELRGRLAAVERAAAALDPGADPDVAVAVRVAGETLPPLMVAAETAVAAAMAARREARSHLLPAEESAWSRIAAARQADHRRGEEMSAAQVRLGELQRGRAAALGVVREAGPGSNMAQLAAAEAEVRLRACFKTLRPTPRASPALPRWSVLTPIPLPVHRHQTRAGEVLQHGLRRPRRRAAVSTGSGNGAWPHRMIPSQSDATATVAEERRGGAIASYVTGRCIREGAQHAFDTRIDQRLIHRGTRWPAGHHSRAVPWL